MHTRWTIALVLLIIASAGAAGRAFQAQQAGVDSRPPNATGQTPAFPGQTRAPEHKSGVAYDVVTAAEGVENPWGLAFLPSGKMLVTERPGRLRIVGTDGTLSPPVTRLPPDHAPGHGGLAGAARDARLPSNPTVYW